MGNYPNVALFQVEGNTPGGVAPFREDYRALFQVSELFLIYTFFLSRPKVAVQDG
jgi:hypothetical protein